jgi:hypothetical protein
VIIRRTSGRCSKSQAFRPAQGPTSRWLTAGSLSSAPCPEPRWGWDWMLVDERLAVVIRPFDPSTECKGRIVQTAYRSPAGVKAVCPRWLVYPACARGIVGPLGCISAIAACRAVAFSDFQSMVAASSIQSSNRSETDRCNRHGRCRLPSLRPNSGP